MIDYLTGDLFTTIRPWPFVRRFKYRRKTYWAVIFRYTNGLEIVAAKFNVRKDAVNYMRLLK